jgi:(p)ppGpp synthase/HD superfamily hydrolase
VVSADLHLSFADQLPLTRKALRFGLEHHAGQRRGGDRAAFVLHPLEVASLVERSGYPDHVVAAAVLHDVLEDTDAKRSDLEQLFGRDVADLVAAVTDDPAIEDEEERKRDLRERVRRLGGYPAVLYAADKVSKVRELRWLIASGEAQDQTATKLARHRASLEMLEENLSESRLIEVLRFEVEALEQLPPQAGLIPRLREP